MCERYTRWEDDNCGLFMMKWIKKIFDNSNEHNSGIVGTQSTSWSQMCKCCFCQPIKSIRPPSHSQFLQASKNCKKINNTKMQRT